MEILTLSILFIISIFTGIYGTLIGGGALLLIPLLMFFGLPPQTAIGTSKFRSIGATSVGTYNFAKHKLIDYKVGLMMAISLVIGTAIGSSIVINLNPDLVKKLIAVFTLLVLTFLLFNKNIGMKEKKKKITRKSWILASIIMFFVGIYAGFFGGGYGTLMSYILLFIFGQTFLKSAGTRKIPGIASDIVAFAIFAINGFFHLTYGIILLVGSSIGAFIGSHYALKIGNEWLRKGFILIVFVMAIKLLIG